MCERWFNDPWNGGMSGSFMVEIKKICTGVIFIWTCDDEKECGDMR